MISKRTAKEAGTKQQEKGVAPDADVRANHEEKQAGKLPANKRSPGEVHRALYSQPPMALDAAAKVAATNARSVPIYAPGQYVSCCLPGALAPYHGRGWHLPEDDLTWIDGTEGLIEMVVRRPRDLYLLTLDVVPNEFGGITQVLEVFFNYFRLAAFEVASATSLLLELPSELFTLRVSRIQLYCPNACVGADSNAAETRRVGIALRGWRLG